MPKNPLSGISLKKPDELFTTEEQRQEERGERIERQFGGIQAQIDSHRENIREQEQRRETAIAELAKPFEQETELAEKSKRLAELNAALDLDKHDSRDAVLMEEEPEGSPPEKKQAKAPER